MRWCADNFCLFKGWVRFVRGGEKSKIKNVKSYSCTSRIYSRNLQKWSRRNTHSSLTQHERRFGINSFLNLSTSSTVSFLFPLSKNIMSRRNDKRGYAYDPSLRLEANPNNALKRHELDSAGEHNSNFAISFHAPSVLIRNKLTCYPSTGSNNSQDDFWISFYSLLSIDREFIIFSFRCWKKAISMGGQGFSSSFPWQAGFGGLRVSQGTESRGLSRLSKRPRTRLRRWQNKGTRSL